MMLAWLGGLLKGPRADAHDAGLAWPGALLKRLRADAHDAGLAGRAAGALQGTVLSGHHLGLLV